MEKNPSGEAVRALLDELETADVEHPDVAVSHESGWSLSAFGGGLVVWENVEEDEEPRHQVGVPRDEVVRLFDALARGDLAVVDAESWAAGYS